MYVVQYINDRGTARSNFFGVTIQDGQEFILPADRCVWRQSSVDGGYQIQAASVIGGAGGTGSGNSAEVIDVRLDSSEGDTITLGYIGKSGRFVPITVPYRRPS